MISKFLVYDLYTSLIILQIFPTNLFVQLDANVWYSLIVRKTQGNIMERPTYSDNSQ